MSADDIYLQADRIRLEFPLKGRGTKQTPVGGEIIQTTAGTRLVALDDISFRLEAGDSLGLLGHNGSGKTTLLRVLSGIFLPTRGTVRSSGIVGNALDLKLGFCGEATGRRNIMLKALISGLRKSQMPMLVRDIEAFAELGPFLDQPLYTYSAGMRARLTFGLATAIPSDILILDEWLGAGDRQMQIRVRERMRGFFNQAAIVVLASHSNDLLRKMCNKGIVLEHGKTVFWGGIEDAIASYDKLVADNTKGDAAR